MKSVGFTIIAFFLINSIFGQTYYSMKEPGTAWMDENQDGIYFSDPYYINLYTVESDTFFNDNIYAEISIQTQPILCTGYPGGCNWAPGDVWNSSIYLRDNLAGEVYIGNAISNDEELLYDFNLEAGDTLPLSFLNYNLENFVISVDSILIGSSYRKRLNIGNHIGWIDEPYTALIEGIGNTNGLLSIIDVPFETSINFICYTYQGETTYFDDHFLTITYVDNNEDVCDLIFLDISTQNSAANNLLVSNNPVTDIVYITFPFIVQSDLNYTLYNSLGIPQKDNITTNYTERIIEMNMVNLIPGIYYLQVSYGDKIYIEPIVKI